MNKRRQYLNRTRFVVICAPHLDRCCIQSKNKEVLIEGGKIDGFMDSFNQLDASGPGWLYPIIGIGKARGIVYDEANEARTKKTCHSFLMSLEAHLKTMMAEKKSCVLVPERLSLADIVGASVAKICFCT